MAKQNKFTKSARGENCTLTIYPYCNNDPETTVLAHINCEDKGMSYKSPKYYAVFSCSNCHDVIDGRRKTDLSQLEVTRCILRGLYRTWKIWMETGVLKEG